MDETDIDMLGPALAAPDSPRIVHAGAISPRAHRWLADHVVGDVATVPASVLVELVARAGMDAGADVIDELTIVAPLPSDREVLLQLVLGGPDDTGAREVTVYARDMTTAPWLTHAVARVGGATPSLPAALPWPPATATSIDVTAAYERLAALGLRYGPAFRAVRAAWRRGDEVFADIALPPGVSGRFGLHPVLLDAALHVSALATPSGDIEVPFALTGVQLFATGHSGVRVHCVLAEHGVSIDITDPAGAQVAVVTSMRTRPLSTDVRHALFRPQWITLPPGPLADIAPADVVDLVDGPSGTGPAAVRERARLTGLPEPERERVLADLARVELASVLGYPDLSGYPVDKPFTDLGFDSVAATQLRARFGAITGLRLPPTLLFDRPTLAELTRYLSTELGA